MAASSSRPAFIGAPLMRVTAAVVLLFAFAGVASGAHDTDCQWELQGKSGCAEAAIANLAVLYAYGIDSLAPGDFDGGVATLQQVFTPDASIGFCVAPGQCFNKTGPLEWAQLSSALFSSGGYSATHHQVGNQRVQIDSNKQSGTMVSYLTATRFLKESYKIDLNYGVYNDRVVKVDGEWRISNRDLYTRSFLRLAGGPGGAN